MIKLNFTMAEPSQSYHRSYELFNASIIAFYILISFINMVRPYLLEVTDLFKKKKRLSLHVDIPI